MLVVKVEMWPGGDQSKKYDLGACVIANQINHGLGTKTKGNYNFHMATKGKIWKQGQVLNFPRKAKGVWHLIHEVLKIALVKEQPV